MEQVVQPVKESQGEKKLTFDPARLKNWRTLSGLTIRQLSARSGVATGTISELENGNKSARVPTLVALACALDRDIADLIKPEADDGEAA